MKFNASTKLTMFKLFLSFLVIILIVFPFYRIGITFPTFLYDNILIDLRYIIAGIVFIFALITDYFDGYLAKKRKEVTIFGNYIDTMVDKILINSVLVVFASYGYISVMIPVIVIVRDIIVDSIRMNLGLKGVVQTPKISAKIKTATLVIGILLTFFYNLPFEVWNLEISTAFLYFGTIMSVISMFDYYYSNKKTLKADLEE